MQAGRWTLERNREAVGPVAKGALERPELLPWRGRLQGYRLGARVFRGRESGGDALMPSVKPGEQPNPGDIAPLPEPKRPDVVVD